MPWVTGDQILIQSGAAADPASAPEPDSTWAQLCADAVSSGIDARLVGIEPAPDPTSTPELAWAALLAGVESYKRREAAFGLTGYVDLQGAAIRVARDYLESVAPLIARYATVGIA